MEGQYQGRGKFNIAKAMIHLICLKVELNYQFEVDKLWNYLYVPLWFVNFVTGTRLEYDIGKLDYGIYQQILYEKCYDSEQKNYILDFEEIIKDKQLREVCKTLKVWDYLYDVYLTCKESVTKLKENNTLNAYHMNENKIVNKYFV